MKIDDFYGLLWRDYSRMAPLAKEIKALLEKTGERVLNDHVAFRTFNQKPISLACLQDHFITLGYSVGEEYTFKEKKLRARSYQHADPEQPLVFFSELLTEQLSETAQSIIKRLCQQVTPDAVTSPAVFYSGRLWSAPRWTEYEALATESEYAAWMSAHGFHANHFTVSINQLTGLTDVEQVLSFVESHGFTVNTSGGRIKGGSQVYLEQGSTMADHVEVTFADGDTVSIPSCFYEFALRFPDHTGQLFRGFVEGNANKIFESTHR